MSVDNLKVERARLKALVQTLGRLIAALDGKNVKFEIEFESDAVVLVASSEDMLFSIQSAIEQSYGCKFVVAHNEFAEPWRNSRRSANLSYGGESPMLVVLCVQPHPA